MDDSKETKNREQLLKLYVQQYLEHGREPQSIYTFCKKAGVEETDFYKTFGSFAVLRKHIWAHVVEKTLTRLKSDEVFETYGPREKVLGFYFTFFEEMLSFRSFLLLRNAHKNKMDILADWKSAKEHLKHFFDEVNIEESMFDRISNQIGLDKVKNQGFWGQFLFLLNFWIKDDSAGFEKTDACIEKTINTTYNLIESNTLESVVDLGKFLWGNK